LKGSRKLAVFALDWILYRLGVTYFSPDLIMGPGDPAPDRWREPGQEKEG